MGDSILREIQGRETIGKSGKSMDFEVKHTWL